MASITESYPASNRLFVEVAVNVPQVSDVFHYHIPENLEGKIEAGHLVTVPFGKQIVQGVVARFVTQPAVAETRPVLDLVDSLVVLTPAQLALADYLADSTLSPLSVCINLMLPAGLAQQADVLYELPADFDQRLAVAKKLTDAQIRLLALLKKRGSMRGHQIDQHLKHIQWRPGVKSLEKKGLLTSHSVLPLPNVRPKITRTAQLACPPSEVNRLLSTLGRAGTQADKRRRLIVEMLLREPEPVNVSWLYAESGGNLSDLYKLADNGLVTLGESEVWRDPLERAYTQPVEATLLTHDQRTAWSEIQKLIRHVASGGSASPILLHGVTGSGKTEIYLRAVEETLQLGRQVIVLVPEIALTPQTIRRFLSRFSGHVGLSHSGLSPGERYDTWRRARNGNLSIIVGARSALFTPFTDLGLIVVDECHDDTYYQQDIPPYYHARQAAAAYARLSGAVCLMGSATPDVTTTYRAVHGKIVYLRLPERILAHKHLLGAYVESQQLTDSQYRPLEGMAETIDLPPVDVIDMRQELKSGNRLIFSRQLNTALEEVLKNSQQAILFLNRRGAATYVFCRNCGYSLRCPNCDIPLTYHTAADAQSSGLFCHYCGYKRKVPAACPVCGSSSFRQYGSGTERVEAEVQRLFPKARTIRWDYDTTRAKGAHEVILNHFISHRADILIGTQMLAKGLDLPLVTLVGVVLADVGLNLPDYRAGERTFQVLMQVSGRAGRSPLGGRVILQTFQPGHYVIQAASRHDYRTFYRNELDYRRKLSYPPFANLVRLEYRHTDQGKVEEAAKALSEQLSQWLEAEGRSATSFIGPTPCYFYRRSGQYRWQVVLRGPNPVEILRDKKLEGWKIEVNPPNLL